MACLFRYLTLLFRQEINEPTPKTIIVAKDGAAVPLPLRERLRIVFGLFLVEKGFRSVLINKTHKRHLRDARCRPPIGYGFQTNSRQF